MAGTAKKSSAKKPATKLNQLSFPAPPGLAEGIKRIQQIWRSHEAYWARLPKVSDSDSLTRFLAAELRPLAPHRPKPKPAAQKKPVSRKALRDAMFQTIRRRLYPRVVPKSVTTADVERQIADAWRSECAAWGVKYFEPPGWDTVNRKLGRGP